MVVVIPVDWRVLWCDHQGHVRYLLDEMSSFRIFSIFLFAELGIRALKSLIGTLFKRYNHNTVS